LSTIIQLRVKDLKIINDILKYDVELTVKYRGLIACSFICVKIQKIENNT